MKPIQIIKLGVLFGLLLATYGCPYVPNYEQSWWQSQQQVNAIDRQTINQSLDASLAYHNPFDSYIPTP